jgi:hypothetical protein
VTLLGIVMLVSLLQPENAQSPILVTLLGIVTLVSPLQPENALSPILVTLLGIVKAPNLPAGHAMRVVWLLSITTSAGLEYAPF